jgi:hypothetical protein
MPAFLAYFGSGHIQVGVAGVAAALGALLPLLRRKLAEEKLKSS